jgi:hypothetical protein
MSRRGGACSGKCGKASTGKTLPERRILTVVMVANRGSIALGLSPDVVNAGCINSTRDSETEVASKNTCPLYMHEPVRVFSHKDGNIRTIVTIDSMKWI